MGIENIYFLFKYINNSTLNFKLVSLTLPYMFHDLVKQVSWLERF